MSNSDQLTEGGIPVESIAGVIIKLENNVIVGVVGVSNAPERAMMIADQMKANDKTPGVDYQTRVVKVYPEHAI